MHVKAKHLQATKYDYATVRPIHFINIKMMKYFTIQKTENTFRLGETEGTELDFMNLLHTVGEQFRFNLCIKGKIAVPPCQRT